MTALSKCEPGLVVAKLGCCSWVNMTCDRPPEHVDTKSKGEM